ncbi:MAG: hypothetical protein ACO37W_16285, partial [Prochlorotrichaceae cyanobacterium]
MNFTEFSFWWILLSLGLPFLGIRWLCQKFTTWSPKSDRIALVFLSLFLFWNAAHNSFIILAQSGFQGASQAACSIDY